MLNLVCKRGPMSWYCHSKVSIKTILLSFPKWFQLYIAVYSSGFFIIQTYVRCANWHWADFRDYRTVSWVWAPGVKCRYFSSANPPPRTGLFLTLGLPMFPWDSFISNLYFQLIYSTEGFPSFATDSPYNVRCRELTIASCILVYFLKVCVLFSFFIEFKHVYWHVSWYPVIYWYLIFFISPISTFQIVPCFSQVPLYSFFSITLVLTLSIILIASCDSLDSLNIFSVSLHWREGYR